MAKILMIVPPEKFRDEELFETKEELEKAGNKIVIASTKKGECLGSLGGSAESEMILEDADSEDYDAVVFVGGVGCSVFFENKKALNIAREMQKKGKIIAAICLAPVILANSGILKGKNASVTRSDVESIEKKGAKYFGAGVVVDGKIITADGPKSSREFGRKIAELV